MKILKYARSVYIKVGDLQLISSSQQLAWRCCYLNSNVNGQILKGKATFCRRQRFCDSWIFLAWDPGNMLIKYVWRKQIFRWYWNATDIPKMINLTVLAGRNSGRDVAHDRRQCRFSPGQPTGGTPGTASALADVHYRPPPQRCRFTTNHPPWQTACYWPGASPARGVYTCLLEDVFQARMNLSILNHIQQCLGVFFRKFLSMNQGCFSVGSRFVALNKQVWSFAYCCTCMMIWSIVWLHCCKSG